MGTIPTLAQSESEPVNLVYLLTKRGIGPALADELASANPASIVRKMIELFDWYNLNNQPRGVGFLVQSIRNPSAIQPPRGFQSSQEINDRKAAEKNRIQLKREFQTKRERESQAKEESRLKAFTAFWQTLTPGDQYDFEKDALNEAEPTKRSGYLRSQSDQGRLFEHYRTIILRDHFERSAKG